MCITTQINGLSHPLYHSYFYKNFEMLLWPWPMAPGHTQPADCSVSVLFLVYSFLCLASCSAFSLFCSSMIACSWILATSSRNWKKIRLSITHFTGNMSYGIRINSFLYYITNFKIKCDGTSKMELYHALGFNI